MQLETIFIAGQVAWELFLVTCFTALLCTIYQVGTEQWEKKKNK